MDAPEPNPTAAPPPDPYAEALRWLARCSTAELRKLELRDLRELKRKVAGLPAHPPCGAVGSNVVSKV